MTRRGWGILVLLAALVVVVSCGGKEEGAGPGTTTAGSDVPANLFQNGSFEKDDGQPWISLTTEAWGTPFKVTSEAAHSGEHSAFLEMRAGSDDTGAKVFGVVQEISPNDFPEILSGYYRIGDWNRGTEKQYLQFVVIVWGATNLPPEFANHQIRYPLAGISEPPFAITNAKFLFVNTAEPTADGWVYFERPIRKDFEDLWGAVPTGFSKLRILFETRYDDKSAGTELKGDVFYDDLYVGPADANPNSPENARTK
jgi:hypothetical protein